ncbi:hypothetical protein NLU13_8192 [Sarocladium strictum]|uniref:DUF6594 domain-containing protein n=1 Tax=Sarocladium strictum TaxID=5046 RepID=A0AA39GCC0_SARSR|nr:hypothetical protein NLU13_8192 [Sarocladium strictum]
MDEAYSDGRADDTHNGTFGGDKEERSLLAQQLSERLCDYQEFLLRQSALRTLPQAPRRNVKSIKNWHYNFDHSAIAHAEQDYLNHEKDLISMIDSLYFLRTLGIWKRRTGQGLDDADPSDEPDLIRYFSNKRIDSFASGVIVTIGVVMLLAPLWILLSLDNPRIKLAVITIFISTFLLILSFAMVAKPFEALAVTAA